MNAKNPKILTDLSQLDTDIKDYFEMEIEQEQEEMYIAQAERRKKFSFLNLFFFSILGLFLLNVYLWGEDLTARLFAHHTSLGWLGLAMGLLALIAFFGFIIREMRLIYRLAYVDTLRNKVIHIDLYKKSEDAHNLTKALLQFTKDQPLTYPGRYNVQKMQHDILNTEEILQLLESEIMVPLDQEAIKLILAASKRVSFLTALTPRFSFEMIYILLETITLIKKIAALYGCRPGSLGAFQIGRHIFHHIGVTSGLTLGDNFIEQFIGHNLAARLSARLGEGFINGLMLARLGIIAMDCLRPFPFLYQKRPTIRDLIAALVKSISKEKEKKQENENNAPITANL